VTKNGAKRVSFSQFDGDTGGYTLYVPEFGGGDVTGAYAITVDPTQRTIQLIHPDGFAVMITKDGIIMRGDDSTWLEDGQRRLRGERRQDHDARRLLLRRER
jgi:hypothetical protein